MVANFPVCARKNSYAFSEIDSSKYFICLDYITKKPIKPLISIYKQYILLLGCSTQGHSVGIYEKAKNKYEEIFFNRNIAQDGQFSRVINNDLNHDGAPDYIIEYSFEGGFRAIFSVNSSNKKYKKVTEIIAFLPNIDYLPPPYPKIYYSAFELYDIDGDGHSELVTEVFKIDKNIFLWSSISKIINLTQ